MNSQFCKLLWGIVLPLSLIFGSMSTAQAATTWYVDEDTCSAPGSGSVGDPFCLIQEAVTAASAGDTVEVAAGTYNELLNIGKALTLRGANAGVHPSVGTHPTESVGTRGSETILSHEHYAIRPSADNIVVDGFKFTGAGGRIIDTYADSNNFHLTNCIFENPAQATTQGVIQFGGGSHSDMLIDFNLFQDRGDHTLYFGGGPYDRLRMAYNTFNGLGDGVFWAASALVDGVIEGNEFDGTIDGQPGKGGTGLNIGQGGNLIIRRNWFHDMAYTAFQVGIVSGAVIENTFEDMYPLEYSGTWYPSNAFQLWGGEWGTAVSQDVFVSGNIIRFNAQSLTTATEDGIRLRSGVNAPTVHVMNNTFINAEIGAAALAVNNQGTGIADASGNWWSTNSSSEIPELFAGSVDYTPWLDCGTDTDSAAPGFQGDFSTLHVDDDSPQVGLIGRIQEALELVSGSTIYIAAGTYNENVDVNTSVTLIGAGSASDAANNTILRKDVNLPVLTFSASDIAVQDMRIEPEHVAGIQIVGTITNITLANVHVVGTNETDNTENEIGLKIWEGVSLSGLTVTDCAFDHLTYGWYFKKEISSPGSNVLEVSVTDTSFSGNDAKGIYVEKLSEAVFERCAVENNGVNTDFWNAAWNGGFDINLKAGEYQNLTFNEMTVTNNGLGVREGAGLMIKARDDGDTYVAHPATLDNVTITDGVFSGNERGIRIGEPGKGNAGPTNVQVHGNNISGNAQTYLGTDGSEYGGVINHAVALASATCNWWGNANGPSGAGPGSGDAVSLNADFMPWLLGPAPDGVCEGFPPQNFEIEKSQNLEFERGTDPSTGSPLALPGDEILYSVEVTNTFGYTVDVLISDAMSAYVDYVAGSLTIYENNLEWPDPYKEDSISYDATFDVYTLAYAFESLAADETLRLDFRVEIEEDAPFGTWIDNFATVSVSVPGLTFEVESDPVRLKVVPEASTFFLLLTGLFGLGALMRRKDK